MPGDEVERTPASPREAMERRLAVIETRARDLAQRHGRLAAGIAITAAAAFGLGMLVYRSRQRKSMVERAQRAIPDSVWGLPEELIAQLKKPLQRAAKAL
jgi:capsid protein